MEVKTKGQKIRHLVLPSFPLGNQFLRIRGRFVEKYRFFHEFLSRLFMKKLKIWGASAAWHAVDYHHPNFQTFLREEVLLAMAVTQMKLSSISTDLTTWGLKLSLSLRGNFWKPSFVPKSLVYKASFEVNQDFKMLKIHYKTRFVPDCTVLSVQAFYHNKWMGETPV